jgi:hypothetical protein
VKFRPTHTEPDDPRRLFLVRALAAGLYGAGGLPGVLRAADFFGSTPEKLKPGQNFYRVEGAVKVNGETADPGTRVNADDTVETGPDSSAIFAVGQDAFLLRADSKLELSGRDKFRQRLASRQQAEGAQPAAAETSPQDPQLVKSLRLVTGGVLTVFGRTGHEVSTPNASIGIRGTGVYFESEPDLSYICTCYGITEIASAVDPGSFENIRSRHHDAPRYVLRDAADGQHIVPAPMKNHSDLELMLLEELVGRAPPFSVSGDNYSAPRRGY